MTHTDHTGWKNLPGSFDSLKLLQQFSSSNDFDIPDLLPQSFPLPTAPEMVPYRHKRVEYVSPTQDICCFYLYDYKFESVWNHPNKCPKHLRRYYAVCSPDFSLYTDMPLPLQLFNTYRSRWCGRFWQSLGLKVIPTVSWSDSASYDFCFVGIPKGVMITVAVPQVSAEEHVIAGFHAGLQEAVRRIKPSSILLYGSLDGLEIQCGVPVVETVRTLERVCRVVPHSE